LAERRRNRLSIAIPASMVSEHRHLRDKTEALGRVGRAAAIYRVDEIIVYPDEPDESTLMKYILGYMETGGRSSGTPGFCPRCGPPTTPSRTVWRRWR